MPGTDVGASDTVGEPRNQRGFNEVKTDDEIPVLVHPMSDQAMCQ